MLESITFTIVVSGIKVFEYLFSNPKFNPNEFNDCIKNIWFKERNKIANQNLHAFEKAKSEILIHSYEHLQIIKIKSHVSQNFMH